MQLASFHTLYYVEELCKCGLLDSKLEFMHKINHKHAKKIKTKDMKPLRKSVLFGSWWIYCKQHKFKLNLPKWVWETHPWELLQLVRSWWHSFSCRSAFLHSGSSSVGYHYQCMLTAFTETCSLEYPLQAHASPKVCTRGMGMLQGCILMLSELCNSWN